MTFRALTSAMIAISLAACGDAQVDADYLGEPLAIVEGTITAESESAHGMHEATLVWDNQHADPGQPAVVATKAPVMGSFPAAFRLKVYTPPPANIFTDFSFGGMYPGEGRIAFGYITTIKAGVTMPQPESSQGGVTGLAEDFLVIYAEKDVQPGSRLAEFLHGPLAKGFHLMKVVRSCFSLHADPCERGCDLAGGPAGCSHQCQDQAEAVCTAECAVDPMTDPERVVYCNRVKDQLFEADKGLKTKIAIRMDSPENLSWPDWM